MMAFSMRVGVVALKMHRGLIRVCTFTGVGYLQWRTERRLLPFVVSFFSFDIARSLSHDGTHVV